MTLLQHNGFRSLRSQLVLSSLLVQVVMLAILVWNSVRITDNALHQLFQDHVDSMVTMMAVSLANPLVQRDYATLDERLGRFLQQDSLVYVVVRDEMSRVVAQRGEVPKKERLDNSFDMPDKIYGQAFDITVADRVVGRAHYGLDVSLLKATLSNMRTQGIAVALIAILLTFLLLATIVYLVTHRLRALALAAQAIRSGDYSVRVEVVGRDEVAVTAQTFNSMAETLAHDINQRKQAEATMQANSRQLQALSKRVLEVQEAERRHVARELHDELGQVLTAIKINLQARNRLSGQSPVEIDSANIGMVDQAIDQVRRLALALRPPMLDDLGLMAALRWAVEQTICRAGVAVQWDGEIADQRLAPEIETACFRITQEAFTNIVRHAQAKNVMIALRHQGDELLLTVHDDGHGFDVNEMRARARAGGSVGVLGMQERAALVGGQLQIESAPGKGTTISANFPWHVLGEGRAIGEEV